MSFVLLICCNPAWDVRLDNDWQLRAKYACLLFTKENLEKNVKIWSCFSWRDGEERVMSGNELSFKRLCGVWERETAEGWRGSQETVNLQRKLVLVVKEGKDMEEERWM